MPGPEETKKALTMYTDGAARGNPGKGGWGTVMMYGAARKELAGAYRHTTNNRMELMAVIEGLKALTRPGQEVTIYSDSSYVVNAVEKGWLRGWLKKGFTGKKNEDLWRQYHALAQQHHVRFVWVKGHASNVHNNRCDELATYAADHGPWPEDHGFQPEEKTATKPGIF